MSISKLYNKQMAISSITSPTSEADTLMSNITHASNLASPPKTSTCSLASSPQSHSSHLSCFVPNSPEVTFKSSTTSHNHPSYASHTINYSMQHRPALDYPMSKRQIPTHPSFELNHNSSPGITLSLSERRQRNKTASAKYRAKRNRQQGDMKTSISLLTRDNGLLQHQINMARQENHRLRATCDRLRGSIIAEKMLKKLIEEGSEAHMMMIDDDCESL